MRPSVVDLTIPDGVHGNLLVYTDFSQNFLFVLPDGFEVPDMDCMFVFQPLKKAGAVLVFESGEYTGWESHWWNNRWLEEGPWQKDFKKLLAEYTKLNNTSAMREIKREQQTLDSYSSK